MKPSKNATILLIACLGILACGILLGMVIQQMIFIGGAIEFAEGLEGTTFNIEIDINETKLIDGFRDVAENVIVPALNNTNKTNEGG